MRRNVRSTAQLLGVERQPNGSPHTRSERLGVSKRQKTDVVDLRLNERRRVKVRLRANLKLHTICSLPGIVLCLATSLDVTADAVVVARGVFLEAVASNEGDGVLRSAEAETSCVAGDLGLGDVVGGFSTEEEAVMAENGISGEGGALENNDVRYKIACDVIKKAKRVVIKIRCQYNA